MKHLKFVAGIVTTLLLLTGCKSCDSGSSTGYGSLIPAPRAAAVFPLMR
jgi:hypothetical protein